MDKMRKMELHSIHPSLIFSEDWFKYLDSLAKTKTEEEFFDVFAKISDKYHVMPGDAALIFSKALFSEEIFQEIFVGKECFILRKVFEHLHESKQE